MEENKIKSIDSLTNDLHDSVDEIYEALMDNENKAVVKIIEEFQSKLKALKENIIDKNEI